MRKPRSAIERLDLVVLWMRRNEEWTKDARGNWHSSKWRRYRRALRALLKEREHATLTVLDLCHWQNTLENRNAVGDAILKGRT